MDEAQILRAYDEQLRRSLRPPGPGWVVERAGPVIRMVSPPGTGWGCVVVASDLDESTADAAIAEQVAFYARLGRSFEWKWFGYDRPADLPGRLTAAGLVPDEPESLAVGPVADVVAVTSGAAAPEGVLLRHLRDDDPDPDYAAIVELNDTVWGGDAWPLMDDVRREREADPGALLIHVAEAGGRVVCAAWVRFHAGTDFASLWGGATLPGWRGRGIYRALVARRALEARERGYRYLQVDASEDSLPILQRLGLRKLTDTTPYNWSP